MTLRAGTRLGRYEILSQLGVGGMGEVYQAQDTKLDRKVALKILPAEVASKQERMARFVREAKAAAALNHPNIAHIYEVGEEEGVHLIAMELVDGHTLRQKIHREHTELSKLLRYLQQVAEGLGKAHAAGIVHRDLKPDNIMISRDGYAKILDFGLAKLVEPAVSMGPQGTSDEGFSEVATAVMPQHSLPGTVMGTAGYMSPEQAQGKTNEIDHRSDIFSFGCILFEAATKRKAFEGKDTLDSLHNIVHAPTPQIRDLNPVAPADLQRIVRRCLAKDPEKRYQSIKEVSIELDEIRQQLNSDSELHDSVHQAATGAASTLSGQTLTSNPASTTSLPSESMATRTSSVQDVNRAKGRKGVALLALALFAVLAAGVAFAIYKLAWREKPEAPLGQMKIARLTTTGRASDADISPDGKYVVHVKEEAGQRSLWLRQIETTSDTQIVPPSDEVFMGITFSRDGSYIYYVRAGSNSAQGVLYQVGQLGGAPRKLNDNVLGRITLSPDGKRMVFRRVRPPGESLMVVANADGTGERVVAERKLPNNFGLVPAWSPDGKSIASGVLNVDAGGNYATLVEIDAESGAERRLTPERWSTVGAIAWLPDKSGLVFTATAESTTGSQIWHVSYPKGEIRKITNDLNRYTRVSLTADASALVTVQQEGETNVWVGPAGEAERARQVTSGRAFNGGAGISWTPDGRIVYTAQVGGVGQIWIMEADGTGARQLTARTRTNHQPAVTRDGRYIVFRSIRTGTWSIWRMDLDGGNVKQLTEGGNDNFARPSPDGRWVVFSSTRAGMQNLWKVSIDGGEPIRLTEKIAINATVSPDGKLIACHYRQQAGDPYRVALIPFEGGEPVKLLDFSQKFIGGPGMRWTPDGRALLYAETQGGVSNIWSLPIDGGAPAQITDFKSEEIFQFDFSRDARQLAVSRGQITNDVVIISAFR